MLQCTRGYIYLKGLVFSCSWDKYSQVELIAGSYDSSFVFFFFEVSPSYFPQWLHQFTSPPILHKTLPFSPYSCQNLFLRFLIFLIIAILIVWGGYLWGFDLYFSGDKWYWASFHIFFCHVCVIRKKVCSDLLPIY